MTINTDERHTIDIFKAAVDSIRTGPDGFPIRHDFLDVELQTLGRLILKVDTILLGRDDLNAEERSLLALADSSSRIIAAMDSGDRDPAIAEAQFRARGELIQPKD